MRLIDTHAHLTSKELADDVPGVLQRARAAGVEHLITVATDVADSVQGAELASRHDGVSCTVGIHPHHADPVAEQDYHAIERLLSEGRSVAFGEIGLDYHYDFSERRTQHLVFARQIEIAKAIDLPLIIHCREAYADVITILQSHKLVGRPIVFHCFTGTKKELDLIDERGWRASFTGIVTFERSNVLQDIAREYPPEKLMLETDSPYLSPVPVRHVRPNTPAHVAHLADFLARLRGVDAETLAAETTRNAREFFNLPADSGK